MSGFFGKNTASILLPSASKMNAPKYVVNAAARDGGVEELTHRHFGRRAQTDMDAGGFGLWRQRFAMVQPELRIFLAEANGGGRAVHQLRKTERREHGIVKVRTRRKIGYRD